MIYTAGIDIGSADSKAVILGNQEILSSHLIASGGNYKVAADRAMGEALAKSQLSMSDIAYSVSTGVGGAHASFSTQIVSDVSCQGRGVSFLFPSTRTVVDVGDLFSKAFRIGADGKATNFLISGKCAGASARSLKVMARVLQVRLDEIGELSLKSQERIEFNTGCAVFAETEVISRIAEGVTKEDLLAGIHRALAAQISTLVERLGIEEDYAVVGGGAKDIALVKALEDIAGLKLLVPDEPQLTAAIGAAIIAREELAAIRRSDGDRGNCC